jgi:hypothetical protein
LREKIYVPINYHLLVKQVIHIIINTEISFIGTHKWRGLAYFLFKSLKKGRKSIFAQPKAFNKRNNIVRQQASVKAA